MKKVCKPLTLLLFTLFPFAGSSQAGTLLVLGDSLSAAYGIPLEQGWVTLLEEKLAPQHRVVNASIGGNTTEDGMARLPKLLQTYQPDLVLIALGGNDGLRGYPTPELENNLTSLIQQVRAASAQPALAGIQIPPSYGSRYTSAFKAVFTHVAEKHDVPLIPFLLEGVALQPALMQADGIHPNAAAQPVILNNVLPVLEQCCL